MHCPACNNKISFPENKIHFRDACASCLHDLHVCKYCQFYNEGVYNECSETAADRVVDKEKANYCEYFKFLANKTTDKSSLSPAEEAKKKLEELFKK